MLLSHQVAAGRAGSVPGEPYRERGLSSAAAAADCQRLAAAQQNRGELNVETETQTDSRNMQTNVMCFSIDDTAVVVTLKCCIR
jgi:hypothetical protein